MRKFKQFLVREFRWNHRILAYLIIINLKELIKN